MSGPISGETTANGSMVNTRYLSTGARAPSAGSEKNNESARAAATMASAAVEMACVRASRPKGVTTNAFAPSDVWGVNPSRRSSASSITHPSYGFVPTCPVRRFPEDDRVRWVRSEQSGGGHAEAGPEVPHPLLDQADQRRAASYL